MPPFKRKSQKRANNFIDITRRKFTRLTVLQLMIEKKGGKLLWKCICDCGNEIVVSGGSLCRKQTQSCGCLQIERTQRANTKHGYKNSHVYRCWGAMKSRCTNPNSKDYPNYGGRGIRLCPNWHSFERFLKDMGLPPTENHTIDRKDGTKGYYPRNCRWATKIEQASNRKNNVMVEHRGETKTAAEWDRYFGFYPGTVARRVSAGRKIDTVPNPNLVRNQK